MCQLDVQNGTSLQELQQLGEWFCFEMVLRYTHLSSDHLHHAAEKVNVTESLQFDLKLVTNGNCFIYFIGAGTRTRTGDLLITKHKLNI